MKSIKTQLVLAATISLACACSSTSHDNARAQKCSPAWYQTVEDIISIIDNHGHGPDLGSKEWRGAVEFRLGIRDQPEVPSIESDEWCNFIHENYISSAT
jgi:hypothetical protein